MAELGELCLWAALPLAVLAAVASIGGASGGRGDLAVLGGRAVEATAALTLLGLAGLSYALLVVWLGYPYVAAFSGFQEPWRWRLAALWSGPAGGALFFTFLIAATGALSYRLGRSRQAAARTGALAVLTVIGLITVLARAQPFAQSDAPAAMGAGLPLALKSAVWQVEMGSVYLAIACAGFVFAGIVGAQLTDEAEGRRWERASVVLAAALLTIAILSATWRAYGGSGRLLDATGLSAVAVHVPAWLLAFAYLHAPGGRNVPAWASRWRRILGVALFPAVLGDAVALLVGQGGVPPAALWAGGLAVGVLSGAMAGLSRYRPGVEELMAVPGFGSWAFEGGLLALGFAGLVVLWALIRGPSWGQIAWPVILLGVTSAAAFAVVRPAGRWQHVWPVAGVAALAAGVLTYALSGRADPALVVSAALAAALTVALIADGVRLRAVRRSRLGAVAEKGAWEATAGRARWWRRWRSAVGHLAIALIVLGLAADSLTRTETRPLSPGGTIAVPGKGAVRVTYLGLSRYQVGDIDKRVASFSLRRGTAAPELVTAAMSFDMTTHRQYRTPALARGVLGDIVIQIAGLSSGEGVNCHVAWRPLSGLVWLGGLLLLTAVLLGGRFDG